MWCDFTLAGILSPVPIPNVSINVAVQASSFKHLLEPLQNVLVNISHSSCTFNGDHVGLSIKTGSIQKKNKQNDSVAQMVVVLTHKEISYLVVGLFDNLVVLLFYQYL